MGQGGQAAVALMLHQPPAGSCELLFIERARHPADFWSGHIAFPGGRRDPGDPDLLATVRREVAEELGVALPEPAGRLDDFDARRSIRPWPLVVSPFVFVLPERPPIRMNYEVSDYRWAPLARLLHPEAAATHQRPSGTGTISAPAVQFQQFTIWGMTYLMFQGFCRTFGQELPQ